MDLSTNELNTVYDASQNQQAIIDARQKEYERRMNARKHELIQIVMRQTEYNETEAEDKLKETEYDVMKVMNNYHGITKKEKDYPKTTNQQIYGEIRGLMDAGAKQYRVEQEKAEKYKEHVEQQEKLDRLKRLKRLKGIKKKNINLEKVIE
tara:strand:- start:22 stop:474 length:453 start_codon:yes stop_codon:yes gene_type:complete